MRTTKGEKTFYAFNYVILTLGAMLCLLSLADDRFMGMQLMLVGHALLLMLYNWTMICNLRLAAPKPVVKPNDGFEHLG